MNLTSEKDQYKFISPWWCAEPKSAMTTRTDDVDTKSPKKDDSISKTETSDDSISSLDWVRFLLLEGDTELESLLYNYISKKLQTTKLNVATRYEQKQGTFQLEVYKWHEPQREIIFKRSKKASLWNPLEISIFVRKRKCRLAFHFETVSALHAFEAKIPGIKLNNEYLYKMGEVCNPTQCCVLWNWLCLNYSFDDIWKQQITDALDECRKLSNPITSSLDDKLKPEPKEKKDDDTLTSTIDSVDKEKTLFKMPNVKTPIALVDWVQCLLLKAKDSELELLLQNHFTKTMPVKPVTQIPYKRIEGTFEPKYFDGKRPMRNILFKPTNGAESWSPLEISISVGIPRQYNPCTIYLKFDTGSALKEFETKTPGIKLISVLSDTGDVDNPTQCRILWHWLCFYYLFDDIWKQQIAQALNQCEKSYNNSKIVIEDVD